VASYEEITAKNYSLSAERYFDVRVDHVAMTPKEFEKQLADRKERLSSLFEESGKLEKQIKKQLGGLAFEN
jgi:type I restriction enzyme M protein